ncbi:hypothetical protein GCM10010435_33980 [Winogradskya consettensis]|uniref:Uncharacterized protein n=1 Tax=Winogradskya consettensis TaxID=113560 RepID=A0A919VNA1_9ACTN|nr:hypothetical protein [Actinoplanes consettensis]GIM69911.1 hypothetical protein Aco04nite_17510 [Actinoplanes consettensis]
MSFKDETICSSMIETELADLHGRTIDELCRQQTQETLEHYRNGLIAQVERPRINLGSGPPGRAD